MTRITIVAFVGALVAALACDIVEPVPIDEDDDQSPDQCLGIHALPDDLDGMLGSVAAPTLDDVHIVGTGIQLHFDGQEWAVHRDPWDGRIARTSVWAGPDFVVHASHWDNRGTISISHGDPWSDDWSRPFAVWASGPDDVYVPGEEYLSPRPFIVHYDGEQWRYVHLSFPGDDDFHRVHRVWGSGPDHVLAATDRGLLRRDEDGWSFIRDGDYQLVWTHDPSTIFLVSHETIEHFDGAAWTVQERPRPDVPIRDLWGYAPDRVWAVGDGGLILHFDGTAWSEQPSGTDATLHDIGGFDGAVFAVGDQATILWNRGDSWSPLSCPQP